SCGKSGLLQPSLETAGSPPNLETSNLLPTQFAGWWQHLPGTMFWRRVACQDGRGIADHLIPTARVSWCVLIKRLRYGHIWPGDSNPAAFAAFSCSWTGTSALCA